MKLSHVLIGTAVVVGTASALATNSDRRAFVAKSAATVGAGLGFFGAAQPALADDFITTESGLKYKVTKEVRDEKMKVIGG